MESLLCLLLLTLLLLVFYSGRQNAINRRCALAGGVFWLGLAKEAIGYNLIPFLERTLAVSGLGVYFVLPYSLMTWALYVLAVPTAIVFASMLYGELPRRKVRWLFYLPAALVSCVYYPWQYHIYQQTDATFWLVSACYNILGCSIFSFLMIRSVTRESDMAARTQKKLVVSVMLPPVLFWVFSAFFPHLFQLTHLDKLWQINAIILLACIAFYVILAFHGGMMGLRLTGESYRWNSDMGLIHRGASYVDHMIKNQTAKMTWCVENLSAQCVQGKNPLPEELMILNRAITALQSYSKKNARYANAIVLDEGTHPLEEMLGDAFSLCDRPPDSEASLCLLGTSNIAWYCDRTHMTEVFLNLFTNALEAMSAPSLIEVRAAHERDNNIHTLCISDHGRGMHPEDAAHIFDPYFTTKDSPRNIGLGLAYCKNVILKHGGMLKVRSKEGKGTAMIIQLPAKRVSTLHTEMEKEAASHA